MNLFDQNSAIDKKLPFDFPAKDGYSFKWDEINKGFSIQIPNGELFYAEHFFDKKISDRSVEFFLENDTNDWRTADWRSFDKEQLNQVEFKNIQWNHDQIKMYGKSIFLPRYSAWYGDGDKPYTYSGLTLQPKPWNKGLLYIKDRIDQVAGIHFNSVLMNWYRDGEDYINWHTDAEKELGKDPIIGSVNFGATRRFQLRRIDDNNEKFEVPLKHGTFLLMRGQTQHFWQHGVPKEKKVKEARFNLTFRIIKA
jgi:alkylated DNA repair dioxygenase AlkB